MAGINRPKDNIGTVPAAVEVEPDRPSIRADGEDVAIVNISIVDSDKRVVAKADNPLVFTVSGPGRIIGVGNGNEASHEPDKANRRKAYKGHAQVLLQSTKDAGAIRLKVDAKGLPSTTLPIVTNPCSPKPSVP